MLKSNVLEYLPGVSELMNRWFAAPGDAGLMFYEEAYVTLANYELKLPVDISLSAGKKVVIRENDGLRDSIKAVTPLVTMDITLSGKAGTWRKVTLPILPNVPVLGGAVGELTGVAGTLLGTSELVDKTEMLAEIFGILRKADKPILIKDREGVLAGLGITAAVPVSFEAKAQHPQYEWSMVLKWDLDESPMTVLFPEQEAK